MAMPPVLVSFFLGDFGAFEERARRDGVVTSMEVMCPSPYSEKKIEEGSSSPSEGNRLANACGSISRCRGGPVSLKSRPSVPYLPVTARVVAGAGFTLKSVQTAQRNDQRSI